MNKLAIALSAALSLGAAASANAADATISFNGTINATSCSVGFTGVTGTTLSLATVTKATVESGSESSRETPFTLEVGSAATACGAGTMDVKFVDPSGSVVGKIGNKAGTDPAGNVAVELLHKDVVLDLGTATISESLGSPGIYKYDMKARYVPAVVGTAVDAGAFEGSVGVELTLR